MDLIIACVISFIVGGVFGMIVTAVLSAERYSDSKQYWKGYDARYRAGRLDEAKDRHEIQ